MAEGVEKVGPGLVGRVVEYPLLAEAVEELYLGSANATMIRAPADVDSIIVRPTHQPEFVDSLG